MTVVGDDDDDDEDHCFIYTLSHTHTVNNISGNLHWKS